jgi:prepilin-type N-terminal cleavage/methylation domain-containing protein
MVKRTNINRIDGLTTSGFTLIEALVAISILVVSLTGPLTLAIKAISEAKISQNQMVAFYLAQEAEEYIRNRRDSNFLSGVSWLSGLNNCWAANGCVVDITEPVLGNQINGCGGGGCPNIKYDESGRYYNYANGQNTIFKRTVNIDRINIGGGLDEAKVVVIVEWPEKSGVKSFVLEDHLFNWK